MMTDTLTLPRLVGLNGYAQSGKDTVAEFLVSDFGYRRIAFADRIKDFVSAVFPDIADQVDKVGWDAAKEQMEVRLALQTVGRAARAHIRPDVWILSVLGDISSDDADRVVVSDVRFINEADALVTRGGVMLRVERPGVGPVNDDESETGLDRYTDFFSVINNDHDLPHLHHQVRETLDLWCATKIERSA
jgi:hypothetical protein